MMVNQSTSNATFAPTAIRELNTAKEVAAPVVNMTSAPPTIDLLDTSINTSPEVVIPVFLASACVLLFTAPSYVAFSRTRNTPQTARFLSGGLLIFDMLATLFVCIRGPVSNLEVYVILQFLALGASFLSYITIAIMSLERLVIFQWPNVYLRLLSPRMTRRISAFIWIVYILPYLGHIAKCIAISSGTRFATCIVRGAVIYIQFTFPFVALVCCTSFGLITMIVCKQSSKLQTSKAGVLKQNRSTLVVFIFVVIYLITAALYIVFSTAIPLKITTRSFILDILIVVNEFADTCAYVLWFRETRLELLKLASTVFPSLQKRTEKMKIDIFEITTVRNTGIIP